MLERLFSIQYTGSVAGTVYGYYVGYRDGERVASVHRIEATGPNTPLGVVAIPDHVHAVTVRNYVESVI
jgi:hypothetical protein